MRSIRAFGLYTVLTILRILREKGFVVSELAGRVAPYSPRNALESRSRILCLCRF